MDFCISRINTPQGIFKLTGRRAIVGSQTVIHYQGAKFMSTDGWVELDLDSSKAKQVLDKIETVVIEHLNQD